MDIRSLNYVIAELALKNLEYEDLLEKAINEKSEISMKSKKVIEAIRNLVLNEMALTKFNSIVNPLMEQTNNQ